MKGGGAVWMRGCGGEGAAGVARAWIWDNLAVVSQISCIFVVV